MNIPAGRNTISANDLTRLANTHYFRSGVFQRTQWMGIPTAKCPMDMWVYQELMVSLKTDLVIETGTWEGGSALFFAHMLDQIGGGRVISVDIELKSHIPKHDRIEYIEGSSTAKNILERVSQAANEADSVLVILDSDHKAEYKYKELLAYADFVTQNSYLIAEDSVFDFFPAWPEFGPGPAHAVKTFMQTNSDFIVDRSQERHMLTFCPAAFLKRTSPRPV